MTGQMTDLTSLQSGGVTIERLRLVGGPCDGESTGEIGITRLHRTLRWSSCETDGTGQGWHYRYDAEQHALVFTDEPCDCPQECDVRPTSDALYDCVVLVQPGQLRHLGPHQSCMGDTWYDGDPVNPATGRPGDIPPDHRDAVVAQYGRYGLAALRRADRRYAAIRRASRWPKLTEMHRTYHHRARRRKGKR